jgi:CrcB protein
MRELLLIALAGALGSIARYGTSGWAYEVLGERFPYGTLVVNVIGSLLVGAVMQVGLSTELISRSARLAMAVGFLGAFTTFSTFSYETVRYLEDGAWWLASTNAAANLVLSLFGVWIGLRSAQIVFGGV